MRDRQYNRGIVIAILSSKHEYTTLTMQDHTRLRNAIALLYARDAHHLGIDVNMDRFLDGVYVCQDLESFLWFERITSSIDAISKELKLSIISDNTSFLFYAMLPAPACDNLHTHVIPKSNKDLDTSRWRRVGTDGSHVILKMDLLSACILYNRQYVLRYYDANFDLALLSENL